MFSIWIRLLLITLNALDRLLFSTSFVLFNSVLQAFKITSFYCSDSIYFSDVLVKFFKVIKKLKPSCFFLTLKDKKKQQQEYQGTQYWDIDQGEKKHAKNVNHWFRLLNSNKTDTNSRLRDFLLVYFVHQAYTPELRFQWNAWTKLLSQIQNTLTFYI